MCKILCDNTFCVYWLNDHCILDEISLNTIGVCTQSIHVDIDESILEKKRTEMLKNFLKVNDFL